MIREILPFAVVSFFVRRRQFLPARIATNTASSFAGSVLLAFSLTLCRSPGISEKSGRGLSEVLSGCAADR
jgi:hypothetical protein